MWLLVHNALQLSNSRLTPYSCCFCCWLTRSLGMQAKGVKEVAEYVAKLRRVGKGLGVYEFDKDIVARANSMSAEAIAIIAPQ